MNEQSNEWIKNDFELVIYHRKQINLYHLDFKLNILESLYHDCFAFFKNRLGSIK